MSFTKNDKVLVTGTFLGVTDKEKYLISIAGINNVILEVDKKDIKIHPDNNNTNTNTNTNNNNNTNNNDNDDDYDDFNEKKTDDVKKENEATTNNKLDFLDDDDEDFDTMVIPKPTMKKKHKKKKVKKEEDDNEDNEEDNKKEKKSQNQKKDNDEDDTKKESKESKEAAPSIPIAAGKDFWSSKLSNKTLEINEEKDIITTTAGSTNCGFGEVIAKNGGIHHWVIKVLNGSDINLGVIKNISKEQIKKHRRQMWWVTDDGYSYWSDDGKCYHSEKFKKYGEKYTMDDVIHIYLNLNKYKISFQKNDKKYDVAYKVDKDFEYRLAVGFDGHPQQVRIVSYTVE